MSITPLDGPERLDVDDPTRGGLRQDGAPLPLYHRIRQILLNQIDNGEIRTGDRLPSEPELCRRFGVSRATVRQALLALEREGVIDRAPGRGTFLRAEPPRHLGGDQRREVGIPDVLGTLADRDGPVIRQGHAVPPPVVVRGLALEPGEETAYFIKVLSDEKGPRAAVKRYFPLWAEARLRPGDRNSIDFPECIGARTGSTPYLVAGWVDSILAEPRFAMMLKVPMGGPLLSVWSVHEALMAGQKRRLICTQFLLPGTDLSLRLVD